MIIILFEVAFSFLLIAGVIVGGRWLVRAVRSDLRAIKQSKPKGGSK